MSAECNPRSNIERKDQEDAESHDCVVGTTSQAEGSNDRRTRFEEGWTVNRPPTSVIETSWRQNPGVSSRDRSRMRM